MVRLQVLNEDEIRKINKRRSRHGMKSAQPYQEKIVFFRLVAAEGAPLRVLVAHL